MHLGLASALTRQAMSYLTFSSEFLCTIAGAYQVDAAIAAVSLVASRKPGIAVSPDCFPSRAGWVAGAAI